MIVLFCYIIHNYNGNVNSFMESSVCFYLILDDCGVFIQIEIDRYKR